MSVIDEIAAERRRQMEAEGWTPEHDDDHEHGQLASAAASYASPDDFDPKHIPLRSEPVGRVSVPSAWPWDGQWWKPTDRRRDLIKAAALIVAEIERLDRAS